MSFKLQLTLASMIGGVGTKIATYQCDRRGSQIMKGYLVSAIAILVGILGLMLTVPGEKAAATTEATPVLTSASSGLWFLTLAVVGWYASRKKTGRPRTPVR